jgi:predicted nucleic-acid-binding Zn-ribbon protein
MNEKELIMKEIIARISCVNPECNYGYAYRASLLHDKLNTLKEKFERSIDGVCPKCHCRMTVEKAEIILHQNLDEHRKFITWKCNKCSTQWSELLYISLRELKTGDNLLDYFKKHAETCCPNCNSKERRLLSMSKKGPTTVH